MAALSCVLPCMHRLLGIGAVKAWLCLRLSGLTIRFILYNANIMPTAVFILCLPLQIYSVTIFLLSRLCQAQEKCYYTLLKCRLKHDKVSFLYSQSDALARHECCLWHKPHNISFYRLQSHGAVSVSCAPSSACSYRLFHFTHLMCAFLFLR